jgi:uncharacterized membrane protein YagU involved in acid resistance
MATQALPKDAVADAVKGAVAGGLGVMALDQVANFLYSRESQEAQEREKQVRAEIGASEMGPTSIGAKQINEKLNLHLNDKQEETLATALHYSLGILPGMLYGMLLGRNEKIGVGRGVLYGLMLFLLNDELMSVQLGWAAKPSKYPWQAHARGLASHLALGVVTYFGFQAISRVLGRR